MREDVSFATRVNVQDSAGSRSPLPSPPPRLDPPYAAPRRPSGVTVLAVLAGVAAAFALLGALGAFAGGAVLGLAGVGPIAGLAVIIGAFFLIYSAVAVVVAFGLLRGRRWAWMTALVIAGFGLLSAVLSFSGGDVVSGLLMAAVHGTILGYLFKPEIKTWFGIAGGPTRRSGGRPT